ncbi:MULTISPECIES: hypothetical protein [Enterobacterales]|uniref:Uncharacterized protein n=1 Tax=Providencia stuartii TaxID=588 RepID=A0A899NFS1_PROST|nr:MULTISPECIES: hypothetical protein [Enterobacterales]QHP74467.1 hypothetical protein EKQ45_00060 [Proteus vulgaris]MBN4867087.1 hypothetical protein [Providencia stuartii]MBN4876794.1 hypothetical protein [Providencia stuartii]MBN4881287.1 hypothetical protein [Providencia stuartii]MBN4885609.1 hypothetical protein [Providencia stuartii]
MNELKHVYLSGLLCIAFSVCLGAGVLLTDKSEQIHELNAVLHKSSYLTDRDKMDREMAEVLLPRLQAQQEEMKKRGAIKKPDMVYVPEQLQQSRGY